MTARSLMGWTGGYVILALLLAPYLRKFGRAGFHWRTLLLHRCTSSGSDLPDLNFLYLRGRPNARGRYRFLAIFGHSDFLGGHRRHGHRLYVRGARRHGELLPTLRLPKPQRADFYPRARHRYRFFISMLVTGMPIPQIGLGAGLPTALGYRC